MIIVKNIFIPRALLTVRFKCPYKICGSMCCVNGDSGAPVKRSEVLRIEDYLEGIMPDLDYECAAWIRENGIVDETENSMNLACLKGDGRCVFTNSSKEGVSCRLETYSQSREIETLRPVSCRLFPIRTRRYNGLDILDYEMWNECQAAWNSGSYLLEFCREALIDSFGEAWFKELLKAQQSALQSLNPRSELQ